MDPKLAARLIERLARLTEAGRVLSTANEKAVRDAIAALQAVLAKVATTESADLSTAAVVLAEADAILAQDDSYDGRRCAVQTALWRAVSAAGGMLGEGPYPWIRDLYDTVVVYQLGDDLYRCDYTINADDSVTLGPPAEVDVAYVPAPDADDAALPTTATTVSTEAGRVALTGDLVPLVEKAVRADGTVPVKIIQPGWGSSGYYPATVLERDGPTVFPRGTHMYVDHPTAEEAMQRPERSVRDLGAVLETAAAYQANGPAGPGLYADARVMPAFAEHLEALAPHIGTSIRADGTIAVGEAEGRKGKIVESLVNGHSIDFVTKPGAGGQVLQLFEAARGSSTPPADLPATTGGQAVDLKEAQALRQSNTLLTTQLGETRTEMARLREAIVLRDARDVAAETLRSIEMPDMTRARLLEQVVANPPVKDGALDRPTFVTAVQEAAKNELAYVAGLAGSGAIRGMGSGGGTSATATVEESAKALEGGLVRLLGESTGKIAAVGR